MYDVKKDYVINLTNVRLSAYPYRAVIHTAPRKFPDLRSWMWAKNWHTHYYCPAFSAPFCFRTGQTDGQTGKACITVCAIKLTTTTIKMMIIELTHRAEKREDDVERVEQQRQQHEWSREPCNYDT